jgi:hypothetical protein
MAPGSKYTDSDGDGFIDTIAFSYAGNGTVDLTIALKDYARAGEDPQKAEIIDPRALGWKGMHELYLKTASEAWDQAMTIYRAAWKRDLTTPELDKLAASASLRQRQMNAWWITEGVARGLGRRMADLAQRQPAQADAAKACHRSFLAALYTGRTEEAVRILAATP